MAFKRALWHSGLTYQQTCSGCGSIISYMDNEIDFRPWYPDGFIYCSRCKTPLRHNEMYALGRTQIVNAPQTGEELAKFCTGCGKQFREGDAFCSACGKKR